MFGAIGIGALIGALGAKQRGGNLLKGALGGAALGGIGGMLGAKYSGTGGLFGFGTKFAFGIDGVQGHPVDIFPIKPSVVLEGSPTINVVFNR